MDPNIQRFGGGGNVTVLHPVVLVLALLVTALIVVLPRRYVVLPVIIATFLIPIGQEIYLAGVHLYIIRLLVLVAFIRAMALSAPYQTSRYAGGWNSIDTAFTCYVVISAVATIVLYYNVEAVINQVGYLWDYLLGYLLLRSLIRNANDAVLIIKCFAGLMVVLSIAMLIEQIKVVNVFGLLGGINATPELRDGKIRSQAVFQHPLTAGTFASIAVPLFFILWNESDAKLLASAGIVAATVMTITTQTSTCLLTYMAGILAVFAWPLRNKMKMVRITAVGTLVGLHLLMKAPVWFIISRIDLTGSSSSYHRAELIDQFVNHFGNWWLCGTKDSAKWGWSMWDVQNMYVSSGETGGLAALIAFALVISRCFSKVGRARSTARSTKQEWFLWLLGAALFANAVAFFGVNYFDQLRMAWFALISTICACTVSTQSHKRSSRPTNVSINMKRLHPLHVIAKTTYTERTIR
jgi:hypothetical protein